MILLLVSFGRTALVWPFKQTDLAVRQPAQSPAVHFTSASSSVHPNHS
jgi:hypothetical protein